MLTGLNAQDEERVFLRLLDPFDVCHRVALLSHLPNRRDSSWAMSLKHEGTSFEIIGAAYKLDRFSAATLLGIQWIALLCGFHF